MTTHNFSIKELAMSLMVRLDRRNIFPPLYNDPETFIPSSDNLTKLSFRRPKRCPNAFLLCRKNVHEEANRIGTSNMRVISKVTSILWKNASPEEKNVYKKLADHVYEIHYRRISIIYKKFTVSSLKGDDSSSSSPSPSPSSSSSSPSSSSSSSSSSTSYKPYSFPLHLSSASSLNTSLKGPSVTPPPSPPSPIYQTITPDPTFNFDLVDSYNFFLPNNQSNNNSIDFNSYTGFGNGQIATPNEHQLPYFYNNIFVNPQNYQYI